MSEARFGKELTVFSYKSFGVNAKSKLCDDVVVPMILWSKIEKAFEYNGDLDV